MAAPLKPEKKSDVDPNFQLQLDNQRRQAQAEGEARAYGNPVKWNMPDPLYEWDGDLFDSGFDKLGKPFQRDKANADYEAATSDPKAPGMAGDLVVTTTQIDLLATMERAFRARHGSRFPRMVAQASGVRRYGHGGEKGVFAKAMLDYVQGLLKQLGQ